MCVLTDMSGNDCLWVLLKDTRTKPTRLPYSPPVEDFCEIISLHIIRALLDQSSRIWTDNFPGSHDTVKQQKRPSGSWPVPSTWYQGLGTGYLVPSTLVAKTLVPSTWYQDRVQN